MRLLPVTVQIPVYLQCSHSLCFVTDTSQRATFTAAVAVAGDCLLKTRSRLFNKGAGISHSLAHRTDKAVLLFIIIQLVLAEGLLRPYRFVLIAVKGSILHIGDNTALLEMLIVLF